MIPDPAATPGVPLGGEALARAVLTAALDCIVIADQNGRVVEWNPAAERTFGYARSEALGRSLKDLIIPPAHHAAHEVGMRRYLETGEGRMLNRRLTLEAVRRDGSVFPCELTIHPVHEGNVTYFTAYLRDLTEQERTQAALREREARYRAVVQSAAVGMARVDAQGRWLEVNPALERFLGYPHEDLLRMSFQDVTHPDDLGDGHMLPFRRLVAGEIDSFAVEKRYVRPDGTVVWASVTASSVRDEHGHLEYCAAIIKDISARKQVEAELRSSQASLRFALETAELGEWILDLRDLSSWRSLRHDAIFGYPEGHKTWTYETFMEHVVPEDRAEVDLKFRVAVEHGEPWDIECRVRRADGAERWIWTRAKILREPDGSGHHMLGIVGDVTDRKTAELERARFMRLIEESSDYIALGDLNGQGLYVNPFGRALLGFEDAGHVRRTNLLDCFLPEDRAYAQHHILPALMRDGRWEGDFRFRDFRTGAPVDLAFNLFLITDPRSGEPQSIAGVCRDLRARKAWEAQLHEQAETLRALNRVGQVISAELDMDRLVQGVTDAGVELTGARFGAFFYSPGRANRDTYALFALSGVSREAFASFPMPRRTELLHPTLSGEAVVRIDDIAHDPRYGHNPPHHGMPVGHLPVRSFLSVPVAARTGEPLGAFLFGHPDPGVFTERSEQLAVGLAAQTAVAFDNARLYQEVRDNQALLERRVLDRTAELQEANSDLEAFAYSASHDLRAPVRHVASFAGVLRRSLGDGENERNVKVLDMIDRSARHMNALVDSLLDFSRLGRKDLALREVRLDELLELVRADLAPECEGRAVEWQVGPLPVVLGDGALLRQVLANLLGNAVKYTRLVPEARIEVWADSDADGHVVHVRDNGAGFDQQFDRKLFTPFQRLHASEEFEGAGLGLANVKRIVQRHGGRVWGEGQVGAGAVFHFSLPRRDGAGLPSQNAGG